MSVVKRDFGKTDDGQAISLFEVTNGKGAVMKVTDYGAILVSVLVPDKNGKLTDVVLTIRSMHHILVLPLEEMATESIRHLLC